MRAHYRLFLAGLLVACGGGDDGGSGELDAVEAVFATSCAGAICHVDFTDRPGGDLDLTAGTACSELVGVPSIEVPAVMRVAAGASASSYLICKLEGCALMPEGASTMPLAGDLLPTDTIAMLSSWVDGGAPGCGGADSAPPTFAGAAGATALPSAIEVSWTAATDDVTPPAQITYLVYASSSSGGQDFSTPTLTVTGATSVREQGLPVSTTRYYVVRARDAVGNTDSNTVEVSATTPATGDETPPTFAGATSAAAASSTSLLLSWNAASDDVSPPESIVYRAYVATASGVQDFGTASATSVPGTLELLVTGLDPATTYFAVVRAVDAAGNEDTNTAEVSSATSAPASFAADVQPILTANCTEMGCHGFPRPQEGLDLRAGQAYASLVDVSSTQCASRALVAPGDPDNSYLVNKITGTNICFGSVMPKTGSLTAAEIQTIIDWVSQGALDN